MRRRAVSLLAGGAVAASVLVGGCGDDDAPITSISTTDDEAATATTSDDFVTSADTRCAEANAAIANLSPTAASSAAAGQELEITRELLDSLRSLSPPSDPSLDDYFAAVEEQIDLLEQQETAMTSGDTATAESLATEIDAAKAEATSAATEFGFQSCGQEGTTLSDTEDTAADAPVTGGATTPVTPAPTTPAPTTAAPTEPVEPVEPVEPPPAPEPTPATPAPTPDDTGGSGGGTSGGSSGGIGPG